MAEIVINNTPGLRVLAYGRGSHKGRLVLPPGKPTEVPDDVIAEIERSSAGRAHLGACARKRIPSEGDLAAQAKREAADKRAAIEASKRAEREAEAEAKRAAAEAAKKPKDPKKDDDKPAGA